MNIVVVGLGSMGKRRIRLLRKNYSNYKLIGVDEQTDRRASVEKEYGIETSSELEEVLKAGDIDCAFICTPPLSHSKITNTCLNNNLHVFSELNLVPDGYDENILLAKTREKVLFLSSTFLYRQEIQKIQKYVSSQPKNLNYTYHVGQYLPDWHPWENYADFFVANKLTNGCRELFAIELPWIIQTFGDIKTFTVRKSKISSLNIDYNDNYMVLLEHKSGHKGLLAVDIISRKAVRNLEVFGEDLYLSWDGSFDGLKVFNTTNNKEEAIITYEKAEQLQQYQRSIVEDAYLNEIEHFFDAIIGKRKPLYDFEKDKETLALIEEIEA